MADYVARFAGATDVLDVGCGRGEFLELLRDAGIPARGVDLNTEMVERCLAKGLDVTSGDALAYLAELPDASLGGIIACQVVEHLQPDDLLRFIELAARRLRPGGVIVLETINPASWIAFFESYIRDLTHVRPVHPDTLRYLLIANGFQQAEIMWRSPTPDSRPAAARRRGRRHRRRRARRGGPDGRSQRRSPERVDVRPARLRRHRPAALIAERPMPTAPPVPRLLGAARVAIVLSALAAPAVHAVLATHQPFMPWMTAAGMALGIAGGLVAPGLGAGCAGGDRANLAGGHRRGDPARPTSSW